MSKLYDEGVVEDIHLEFSQPNFLNELANNYGSKTEIEATLTYKDKVYESVGVRYRGNTSYLFAGDKKSFSIDLEANIDGQDINGYNELKLNNWSDDASSMREVLYANLARKNIPSARGNFINLYINGENYGIYSNIQKLDRDHVKEWFLDGDATRWRAEAPSSAGGGFGGGGFGFGFGAGTSTLNNLGENGSDYEQAYTLKKAYVDDPWQDLANAAYALGVTSNEYLIEQVSQYLDIDGALWMVATENVFEDDDGYISKGGMDYYLYYDLATGRIVPIEYDGNTILKTTNYDPFKNVNNTDFPLLNRLLNIPELRQRYLAHYRTIMEESLNPSVAHAKVDAYDALINSYHQAPAVRNFSYNQYLSGVSSLKNQINTRYSFLRGRSEVNTEGLSIANVRDAVNGRVSARPSATESVQVNAEVSGDKGVRAVYLYYGEGLAGNFSKIAMTATGGGAYEAEIPPHPKGAFVRYYLEAIADDSAATATYEPVGAEHDVFIYQVVSADRAESPVVVNEIMPANDSTATDEEGEYGDWIELYNNSSEAVDLSGWHLSDEENRLDRWTFPSGTVIAANGTLIVWADDKEDLTTGLHANFKLSADGENLYLVTPDMGFADQLTFGPAEDDESFARLPNGSGAFSWTSSPTFDDINQ